MPNQTIRERLKHAWNAFANRDPTDEFKNPQVVSYYSRPDRPRFFYGQDKSIVKAIINTIAIDCSTANIKHCRVDENDNYLETIRSDLNDCFNVEANIDQTGRAFMLDLVSSLLEEGCVAVVPIETDVDPNLYDSFKIYSMRVGKVIEWYPRTVKIKVYNDRTGQTEDIMMRKSAVAIIENPRYSIMNEPNSTLKRLVRKINLLDSVDEQQGANKLDMIIQLPYIIKTEARKQQAEKRRKDIELQLASSEYGIAYTDGTEKITQLNRPIESNLQEHVDKLTEQLYSQLGLTPEIFNGTADEKATLNFYNRTIDPILSAIADEFKRKFLTKTARTQGQSIQFFIDHFRLVPTSQMAEIFDKLGRNAVLTSNEMRSIIGFRPSDEPVANELVNSNNMTYPEGDMMPPEEGYQPEEEYPVEEEQNPMEVPVSEIK